MSKERSLSYDIIQKGDKIFRIWQLIFRTRDVLYKVQDKELQGAAGISAAMSGVLVFSQLLGNRATPAELARWLTKEPHNLSQLMARMEKKGLLTKTKDLPRKNQVRVELTSKGRQAYKYVAKRLTPYRMISFLSENEQGQLSSCLEKLRSRASEELGIKIKPPWP